MSFSWLLTHAITSLLLPPVSLVLLALAGWRLSRHWRKTGLAIVWLAALMLLALSTQAGSRWLVGPLEARWLPLEDPLQSDAQAIVILGGGRLFDAPEDGGRAQPSAATLMRVRHGARLHRQTGLPVLVSGGAPDVAGESEAVLMARSMNEDFGLGVRWLEPASNNTEENARYSAQLLGPLHIRRILLVSDAMQMLRASLEFTAAGFEVVPAPTAFCSRQVAGIVSFFPNARELDVSSYAVHEWLGLLWYRIRHGFA